MAITYPYSISFFADLLRPEGIRFPILRFDETYQGGDGRIWQAELADPLWTADLTLVPRKASLAKVLMARVRKLYGSQEAFFLFDPQAAYPASDPDGTLLGSATPQVGSIGVDNKSLTLKGLPNGYTLTEGDKIAIDFGTMPTRRALLEVSEAAMASVLGVTGLFEVFPHLPTGLAINDAVTLIKPAALMVLEPNGFDDGFFSKNIQTGMSLRAVQRLKP